ncbi:MAG TPA: hypothetical protein VKE42_02110 [Candidatus Cybelea sp.]|nr:hypothetical protein [Candidatus Cybelea sp.]
MNILKAAKTTSERQPTLPRAIMPTRPATQNLHEDALRFGQQIVDLQQTAATLQSELDNMTRRTMLAEEEVRRLDMRIAQITKTFEEREAILIEQRDHWKMQYADVETNLQLAAHVILDVMKKSETRRGANVNMKALAEEIEQSQPSPPPPPPPLNPMTLQDDAEISPKRD